MKPLSCLLRGIVGDYRAWILAATIAASPGANAADCSWTTGQKAAYGIGLAANVLDWDQTLRIADNPDRFGERNMFLGLHPDRGSVNTYFIGTTALLAALPFVSDTYRKYLMGTVSAGLVFNVGRNYAMMGFRTSF